MKLTEIFESKYLTIIQIRDLANKFKSEYEGPKGSKAFGCSLKELYAEGGNCSMISNEFCKWLDAKNIPNKTINGNNPSNPKWNDGDKGSFPSDDPPPAIASHTATVIGNYVIDFNAKQFDISLPYPRITSISKFESEWKITK